MLPTPDLSHLTRFDFEKVYEPAEDTFVLLDALEADATQIQAIKPLFCVEIGSGSGCVVTFLSQIINSQHALFLATDINTDAASATQATAMANKARVEPILTFTLDALLPRLDRTVDILIFNPPYVPTEEEEAYMAAEERSIAISWAGGVHGRNAIEQLLTKVGDILSDKGRFYLVTVPQNKPDQIASQLAEQGFKHTLVLKRKAGREHLSVWCFYR